MPSCWARPTRHWRQAFSISANIRSAKPSKSWRRAAFRCEECEFMKHRRNSDIHSKSGILATAEPNLEDRFLNKKTELEIDKLFRALVKLEGSDLHLKVDRPPLVRVHGTLRPMSRPPIDDAEMVRLCFPMLNERTKKIFDESGGADFAYSVEVDG